MQALIFIASSPDSQNRCRAVVVVVRVVVVVVAFVVVRVVVASAVAKIGEN